MAVVSQQKIRESLMAQLKAKGADVPHFEELVNEYMDYLKLEKEAKKDIKNRGSVYTAISAAGKEYEKDNPNVKMLPQYTRARLSILKELGLTTEKIVEEDSEL